MLQIRALSLRLLLDGVQQHIGCDQREGAHHRQQLLQAHQG